MKKKIALAVLAAMMVGATASAQDKIPAFPDAEGGGMWATGARGGETMEVYHVTNLNNSGPGSFRDAVSKGNRFVVFDVGGNINITSRINIREDNITILGQTAPGDGISIDGEGIHISGSNVIMRYLRVRRGEGQSEGDSLWMSRCRNVIIDHCSFCWSVDECVSFTYVENTTVQWSIISEALNSSTHTKGIHGYGGIWAGINSTGHHNLLASNTSRNPRIGSGAGVDGTNPDTDGIVNVRNNVMYNWGNTSAYGGENGMRANFIGNYYKPGPASKNKNLIYSLTGTTADSTDLPENGGTTGGGVGKLGWSTTLFVEGNYLEGNEEVSSDNWKGVKAGTEITAWKKCESISDGIYVDGVLKPNNQYLDEYPIITQNAHAAYDEVVKYAGASLKRDAIDERVINDVINGTAPTGSESGYGLIDTPADVGGFIVLDGGVKEADSDNDGIVDSWEIAHGLDENLFDSLTIAEDGYTMLEKYAEELSVHEGETKADKTALRKTIYQAQRMDKYGYTKASWNNLQIALDEAEETAAVVYALQVDIDNACDRLKEALSLLETDEKYDLRVVIDAALLIDSSMYTMDSYLKLMNAIDGAEAVYADAEATQTDVDAAIENLQIAIDALESCYGNMLNELIGKVYELNQANYTYESMDALVMKLREAEAVADSTDNALLRAMYEELKSAYDALDTEKDAIARFTGDFENFVDFRVVRSNYGEFTVGLKESECEVAKNMGDNSTKALVLRDTEGSRTSLTYNFPEKQYGFLHYEGDFYFEDEPKSQNLLLRLVDRDIDESSYLTLLIRKPRLQLLYFGETYDFPEVVFEAQKWYNLQFFLDTATKHYSIWLNGDKIAEGVFADTSAQIGIDSYMVATPGSESQTMAVDNLRAEIINEPMIINHEFSENQFKCDIVNYGQEKLRLVLASYAGGRLIDVNMQDIPTEMYAEDITASVSSGDEIKAFLWRDDMEPVILPLIR